MPICAKHGQYDSGNASALVCDKCHEVLLYENGALWAIVNDLPTSAIDLFDTYGYQHPDDVDE